MKVLCAPMEVELGHTDKNAVTALGIIESNKTADYILFPPLFLTGCTCGSLFEYDFLKDRQNNHLNKLISMMPPKVKCVSTLMDNGVEKPVVFDCNGVCKVDDDINIATDTGGIQADKKNFLCLKHKWIIGSIDSLLWSLKGTTAFFTSCGKGESSAREVYSGVCGGVFGNTYTAKQFTPLFADDTAKGEKTIQEPNVYPNPLYPFVPQDEKYLDEAIEIMSAGLRRRLNHLGRDRVVIGVSGGLDSTLALLIADNVIADKNNIFAITMPGLGTGAVTRNNADVLMKSMGVRNKSISIKEAVLAHFTDIGHDGTTTDVAYENAQARERMQVLFDISNMEGALNIGTGDLSEAMLGFTTFGGDHLSMYNVNCGVPKTLVKELVLRFAQRQPRLAEVLRAVAKTPISPELVPGKQETEKIVGSYQGNDFAIYHTVVNRLGREELAYLMKQSGLELDLDDFYRRVTRAQFKRNCSADGVQVTSCSVGPYGDFEIPSDCRNVF